MTKSKPLSTRQPNEQARESPLIQHNIDCRRLAVYSFGDEKPTSNKKSIHRIKGLPNVGNMPAKKST